MALMCRKIDCYIEAFKKLRTDRNRNRWSALTKSQAPYMKSYSIYCP